MFEKLEYRAEIAAHLSGPARTDCSLQGLAVDFVAAEFAEKHRQLNVRRSSPRRRRSAVSLQCVDYSKRRSAGRSRQMTDGRLKCGIITDMQIG